MFCTPSPTLETSSEPSFRRPSTCACVVWSAVAGVERPPAIVAAATAPVTPRKERRSRPRLVPLSPKFCIFGPFIDHEEGFGLPLLTTAGPVFPTLAFDRNSPPCQTRQYDFQSRQSRLARFAGFLACSEW